MAELSNTLMPQQLSCAVMYVTFFTSGSTGTMPNSSLLRNVCRKWGFESSGLRCGVAGHIYPQTMKATGSFRAARVNCTVTQHHFSGHLHPLQHSSQKRTLRTLPRKRIMTRSSTMTAQYYPLFLGTFAKQGKIEILGSWYRASLIIIK